MADDDRYRKYFEAFAVLGQITRARASEMLREMMAGGDEQRAHVQRWLDEFVDRSRKATEGFVDLIRAEVASQVRELGLDPEDLAHQAADILRRTADEGRRVVRDRGGRRPPERPSGTGPAAKKAAKASPAPKKAAAKKAPAKKQQPGKQAAAKAAKGPASAKRSATPKKAAAATRAAPKKTARAAPSGKAPARRSGRSPSTRG